MSATLLCVKLLSKSIFIEKFNIVLFRSVLRAKNMFAYSVNWKCNLILIGDNKCQSKQIYVHSLQRRLNTIFVRWPNTVWDFITVSSAQPHLLMTICYRLADIPFRYCCVHFVCIPMSAPNGHVSRDFWNRYSECSNNFINMTFERTQAILASTRSRVIQPKQIESTVNFWKWQMHCQ